MKQGSKEEREEGRPKGPGKELRERKKQTKEEKGLECLHNGKVPRVVLAQFS